MISTLLLSTALAAVPLPMHPLGQFGVHHAIHLEIHPDHVAAEAVLDLAEVPTLQLTPTCSGFAADIVATAGGKPLQWTVASELVEHPPGEAGLSTTRLTCQLQAPADISGKTSFAIENKHLTERIGWHEISATGVGVALDTQLPSESPTNMLRDYSRYWSDPLMSALDLREAEFNAAPGADAQRAAAAFRAGGSSILQRAESWLLNTIGDPTPLVGLLAVLLSLVLGAAHAAMPGHGKTVMAVYLAGRAGRPRDALVVGATVTLSHTGSVLVIGLLLTTMASLAGESVLSWLGMASGVIVAGLGAFLLFGDLRHSHAHKHGHHHHHHHDHQGGMHKGRLAALGLAGGLVPSPSALVVLLGAIALGHTWFGVLLIVAYGLGMAATLTAAGLLLLKVRDRWSWLSRIRIPRAATSSLIVALGFGLVLRAAFGI